MPFISSNQDQLSSTFANLLVGFKLWAYRWLVSYFPETKSYFQDDSDDECATEFDACDENVACKACLDEIEAKGEEGACESTADPTTCALAAADFCCLVEEMESCHDNALLLALGGERSKFL